MKFNLSIIKKLIVFVILSSLIITVWHNIYFYESKVNILKTLWSYFDDVILYHSLEKSHPWDVVIITIDDKTLDSFQEWDLTVLSFSKELHAQVIENLFEKYEAKVVWVDIVYANKSKLWEEDENTLKSVFEKYPDRIVIWSKWVNTIHPLCKYNIIEHWAVDLIAEARLRKFPMNFNDYTVEIWCTEKIDKRNMDWIDTLGLALYRKYILWADNNAFLRKSKKIKFIKENIDRLFKQPSNLIKINESVLDKKINSYLDQLILDYSDKNWNLYLSFHKKYWWWKFDPMHWYESYSLFDIYQWKDVTGEGKKIDLKWKIVLIWEAWTLFHDSHLTPVNLYKKIPWVELHANLISTIKNKNFLKVIDDSTVIILTVIYVILIMWIILSSGISIGLIAIIIFVLFQMWFWRFMIDITWNIIWFHKANLYIYPVFYFIFIWIFTFITTYVYRYITEEKDKRFIKSAFWHYVSPNMVEAIMKDPKKLHLGGETRDITIFFSDLAWFTSISEKMEAEELFNFLNDYLTEMTDILTKNKWTLDKYIWDAIMWFYNAPLEQKKHEYFACLTAVEQQEKIIEMNERLIKKWLPEIIVRIGINTWRTMHWNLGSKDRFNYTVIWDSVNLASRLESVNKQYWTLICISEWTYKQVKDKFVARELDIIRVKWKEEWVKIYELIGRVWDKYDEKLVNNYENWLKEYYKWNYQKAISEFNKNKDNDQASINLVARCKDAIAGKVEIINGVFTMKTK